MLFRRKPQPNPLPPFVIQQEEWRPQTGGCGSCRSISVTDPYIGLGKQPASQPIMYGPFQQYPYPTHYPSNEQ